MRGAGKIVEAIYQRVGEVLRPGIKQFDGIAELTSVGTRGVDASWGDYLACVPNLGAGSDASAPHLTWTDRRYGPTRASSPTSQGFTSGITALFREPIISVDLPRRYWMPKRLLSTACTRGSKRPWSVISANRQSLFRSFGEIRFENESLRHPIGMGYPPAGRVNSASLRESRGDKTELSPGNDVPFHVWTLVCDWASKSPRASHRRWPSRISVQRSPVIAGHRPTNTTEPRNLMRRRWIYCRRLPSDSGLG